MYESDALTAFVGAALEVDPIYRQADQIGALTVMFYGRGDELGWHFDNADFVVTLMLQARPPGGVFEYVPMLRTPDDDNAAGVARAARRRPQPRAHDEPGAGHPGPLPRPPQPASRDAGRPGAVADQRRTGYADRPDARLSASALRIFFGR